MKTLLLILALLATNAFAQQAQEVVTGSTVTMKVTVPEPPPGKTYGTLKYQWLKNNSAIRGATTDTLSIAVSQETLGTYYVAVSNAAGEIRSNQVTIQFTLIAPIIVKDLSVTVTPPQIP